MEFVNNGATKPYHLRPHKAIERSLFVKSLKMLDRISEVDLKNYRYVGFGAAFLEDFKVMHTEFGITHLDSIEIDSCALSRQKFNKPYSFIKLYDCSSTEYINGGGLKFDRKQVVWLDYASGEIEQQLQDIEQLCQNLNEFDILKVTLNAKVNNPATRFRQLQGGDAYNLYIPPHLTLAHVARNYPKVLRQMIFKAIKRGLSGGGKNLVFNNLTAFTYSDGQTMTTMMGVISKPRKLSYILRESGLQKWPFTSLGNQVTLEIDDHGIEVPAMTVAERIVIDRKIKKFKPQKIADSLSFRYGTDSDEPSCHEKLVEGYLKYYNYLPYYSKITI